MKRINGKLLTLCATALLFYGCEKEEDLLTATKTDSLGTNENCETIDFENVAAGTYVSSVSTTIGNVGIEGFAVNENDVLLDDMNRARIFDSENPTGDDDDLETEDWGNVLIVQDIEEGPAPNDNKYGAQLTLYFPEPVTLSSMNVIDIDNGDPRPVEEGGFHPLEDASYAYLYVEGEADPIAIYLAPHGDNVGFEVNLLNTENVVKMVVVFDGAGAVGSGAIDDIVFCVPEEVTGCTRTQGYWKNHASGKKADPAWGSYADDPFFSSGLTYLEVLNTPPKKGDVYFILAHQYIAAFLNMEAGASSTTEVDAAFEAATKYFNEDETYTRAELLEFAETLDRYNNGLIGPGPCDD